MSDKEIPDMTDGGAAASGDLVHVVRSGNSRKAALGDAAGKSVGTSAGTVAAGDDSRITGAIASSLLTTRGDIIVRGASAAARLAKGTQKQVLEMGADEPAWAAPAGLKLLNSGTVTNAASLDIVLSSFTAYRGFRLNLDNFIPATDSVAGWFRFSANGGSSYDAGAGNYRYVNHLASDAGAASFVASTSAAQISTYTSVGNGAAEGISIQAELMDPFNSAIKQKLSFLSQAYVLDDTLRLGNSFGLRTTAQIADAIQFLFSSGNIASGKWALYGYA